MLKCISLILRLQWVVPLRFWRPRWCVRAPVITSRYITHPTHANVTRSARVWGHASEDLQNPFQTSLPEVTQDLGREV